MSNESNSLEEIYQRRFGGEAEFRNKMWQALCADFFQKYIPQNAVVLEIAAGYCEFINNIIAGKKIAIDLNSDAKKFAANDVELVIADSANMSSVKGDSCDVVFVSNFFEHLIKENIVKTIKEARRVLKKGGRFLILQPNIRFCFQDYWNFFDHITPLDDKSLTEALEINGFKVVECRPKFLPYSTKSKLPKNIMSIKLYLKMPILHNILGKQAFIYAEKI